MSQSKAQLTNPFGTVNITDGVNVSGVITATTLIGDGTALTGIALTGNINTTGIITASEFYGYGGGLDNVGLGTEDSINTTGIITAGQFYGDGSLLTNIGGVFAPLTFAPSNGSTDVGITTNITILFNKSIQAGVGTITLRTDSASGTIEESFDVTSSDRLTFSAGTLTIDPTAPLSGLTTYYTVLPAGTVKDTYGLDNNTLIDNYSFTTRQLNFELYVWGSNAYGHLGLNNRTPYSSPIQIPGTQWSRSTHTFKSTIATKSDGTLWVWGNNQYGDLGQNDLTRRSSPVQLPGTQWNNISALDEAFYSTKTDGTLWSWGRNNGGKLGQNDNAHSSSPVQIAGTQWNYLSSSSYGNTAAVTKTDNTLWVWGGNFYGSLGQNDRIDRSSPRQIPGTAWNTITTNRYQAIATKTDGTLWTWGLNESGQLGQNNRTHRSSPVQIPGTEWSFAIVSTYIETFATKTDGTLWAWGHNAFGELGHNNRTAYSSPVQIPGTEWDITESGLAQRYVAGLARKTDGTLWSWGYDYFGAGGVNNGGNTSISSPVQIAGTQWTKLQRGSVYATSAIKQA